jgi:hypothetical protein
MFYTNLCPELLAKALQGMSIAYIADVSILNGCTFRLESFSSYFSYDEPIAFPSWLRVLYKFSIEDGDGQSFFAIFNRVHTDLCELEPPN